EQSPETSVIAMERVRDAVERLAIPHVENRPHGVVTISIGLVGIGRGEQLPWEVVLHRADTALYRAKAEGRNRVALGGDDAIGLAPDPHVMPGLMDPGDLDDAQAG